MWRNNRTSTHRKTVFGSPTNSFAKNSSNNIEYKRYANLDERRNFRERKEEHQVIRF